MNEPRPSAEMQALRVLWTLFAQTYLDASRLPGVKAVHAACSALSAVMEGGELGPDGQEDDLFVARLILAIEDIDEEQDTAVPFLLEIARGLRDLHRGT